MTRQALIRVLLSLLLLISQQMASSHVMSHLASSLDHAAARAHQPVSEDMSSAFAQDQSCNQCLAFAQLAGPLISTPPDFILPQQPRFAIEAVDAPVAGARIILAFQSRGPPVLS
jgi:hypothetical protein